MLRKALIVNWRQHMPNKELYGELPQISTTLRERRLKFAGHCKRNTEDPVSKLLLWEPAHGIRKKGQPAKLVDNKPAKVDTLKEDTGVATTEELRSCMMDRVVWKTIVSRCSQSVSVSVSVSDLTIDIGLINMKLVDNKQSLK